MSAGGGEVVLLLPSPLEVGILRFNYDDLWHPQTDGGGYSLVIADPYAAVGSWSDGDSWRQGGSIKGTPGSSEL